MKTPVSHPPVLSLRLDEGLLAVLIARKVQWLRADIYEVGMAKSGAPRDGFFCFVNGSDRDLLDVEDVLLDTSQRHRIAAVSAGLDLYDSALRVEAYMQGALVCAPDLEQAAHYIKLLIARVGDTSQRRDIWSSRRLLGLDEMFDRFFSVYDIRDDAAVRANNLAIERRTRSQDARDEASAVLAMFERMSRTIR
jgi:hypothetical protein